MKKIFMASLVAMMAVTAANADIASTTYVDTAVEDLETTKNKLNSLNNVSETDASVKYPTAGAVLSYVNATNQDTSLALAEKVAIAQGLPAKQMLMNTDDEGNVVAAGIVDDGNNAPGANYVTGLAVDADGQLVVSKGKIDVSGDIDTAIAGLDVSKVTATDGNYFNAYAETDGKISMEQKKFEETLADNVLNAPQTGAVKSYVDNKIIDLDATVNATANQVVTGVVEVDGKLTSVASTQITDAYVAANAGIAQSKIAGLGDALGGKLDKSDLEDAAKKAADQGDGTYALTMKVVEGKIVYQWDLIDY